MNKRFMLRVLTAPVLALALASCADAVQPTAPRAPETALRSTSLGPTLIECPTSVTKSKSAVIGPVGGVIELDGHRMAVPLGAVKGLKQFTLTVPASNYMEVDLKAGGQEHFQFDRPVSITIDYSRCTRSNIDGRELRIFYVDPVTKAILADMGGVDDKTARVVTTSTDHLSAYSIGVN